MNKSSSNLVDIRYISSAVPSSQFSLPSSIIYYIAKNPYSFKIYQRLISASKYFLVIKRILICTSLEKYNNNYVYVKGKSSSGRINQKHLENPIFKIWITEKLCVADVLHPNFTSRLLQNVYQYNISSLILCHQTISFADFTFIIKSSKIQICELLETIITHGNGNAIPLEKILEPLHQLESFEYHVPPYNTSSINSESALEIKKICRFKALTSFVLYKLPPYFDLKIFGEFMKIYSSANFEIEYNASFMSAGDTQRLTAIRQEIRQSWVKSGRAGKPKISFPIFIDSSETL